jgi:hypothetical protein
MLLASAMGFRTPPFALMPLANGELAYIVRRFDRVHGKKIPCEDMAQILGNANERRLSPVYDLLNTKICMPDDSEDCAISIADTKNYVTWETFLEFTTSVGIPARIAKAHIRSTKKSRGKVDKVIGNKLIFVGKRPGKIPVNNSPRGEQT